MGQTLKNKPILLIVVFGIGLMISFGLYKSVIELASRNASSEPTALAPQSKSSNDSLAPTSKNLPVIATLTVNSADIKKLPITLGTDDAVLDTGMAGAYPWSGPGQAGVFTVSAHRVGAGGPFLNLDRMQVSDLITVTDNAGKVFNYRVTSVKVVDPSDVSVLKGPKSESRLVLITCTPIETYADRLVVTAVLDN